jgi:tRNA nucleotidyltransferase (CCA-adding enzyme)
VQNHPEGEVFARVCALPQVASIVAATTDLGYDVYLVGGTVRDLILERQFLDVDLAVDGDALAVAATIGTPSATETRFGTVSVTSDGYRYDLARTRGERYPQPGALPEVAPAGIDADLERRDFTVNALAVGLNGSRAGELIAVPSALHDLEAHQLAVLHDSSFLDDPTRLMRLARYSARLGFTIAPHTRELATEAIRNNALDTISGTRIGNELRLLANEPDPIAAFEATAALGLPWALDPEMTRKALDVLPTDGRPNLLVLASVFGLQPNKQLLPELDRLGFTATDRDTIVETATESTSLAQRLSTTNTPSEIARVVGPSGIETVALAFSQGSPSQSLTWLRDLRHVKLEITGSDLIDNGIPEGPEIGRALTRAKSALMDGQAPDRDTQLEVALNPEE